MTEQQAMREAVLAGIERILASGPQTPPTSIRECEALVSIMACKALIRRATTDSEISTAFITAKRVVDEFDEAHQR